MPEIDLPFLRFSITQRESRHLLRALSRAAAVAVSDALPEERPKARADADAYDALRDRLLTEVAALEVRSALAEPDDDFAETAS